MPRTIRFLLAFLLAAFVAIQFKPVDRSLPAETNVLAVPADLEPVLERACFDCHTNRTRWPWYGYVAPASWFLEKHVREGREHLNFSEWPTDPNKIRHQYHEIEEVMEEGEMPLPSYLWIHRDAELTLEETERLIAWATAARAAVPQAGDGDEDEHEGHDH
jgi:hypothetical protein